MRLREVKYLAQGHGNCLARYLGPDLSVPKPTVLFTVLPNSV